MSRDKKLEVAKGLTADRLVELYDKYRDNFNPCNEDTCETLEIIRNEILRRLNDK